MKRAVARDVQRISTPATDDAASNVAPPPAPSSPAPAPPAACCRAHHHYPAIHAPPATSCLCENRSRGVSKSSQSATHHQIKCNASHHCILWRHLIKRRAASHEAKCFRMRLGPNRCMVSSHKAKQTNAPDLVSGAVCFDALSRKRRSPPESGTWYDIPLTLALGKR